MCDVCKDCKGCNGGRDPESQKDSLSREAYIRLLRRIVERHDGVFHLDENTGDYQFDVPMKNRKALVKELNVTFSWNLV